MRFDGDLQLVHVDPPVDKAIPGTAPHIVAHVDRDPAQPRLLAAFAPERGQCAIGFQKGFLIKMSSATFVNLQVLKLEVG